jgi:integrase
MSRKQLERRPLFAGHRPEKGLLGEMTRHGREVWYYRVGHEPRIRIRGEFGSPAFIEAFKAAKWGVRPSQPMRDKKEKHLSHSDPTSLGWLIDQYLATAHFAAANTKKQHRNVLRAIARKNGGKPFLGIDDVSVSMLRDHVAAHGLDPEKPGPAPANANRVVSVLRALFAWAAKPPHKLVSRNPAVGVAMVEYDKEARVPWTLSEQRAFEEAYPLGTRERLAYELGQCGLRCSDIVRMGPQHLDRDGDLIIKTKKNHKTVTVTMRDGLKAAIAASPCGKETFLCSEHDGSSLSEGYLSMWFSAACKAAGIADCTAHGLRHTAVTRALETGVKPNELMAAYGFTLAVAENYCKQFDGRRSAKSARALFERPALRLVEAA